jgi:pimeloyl-ACP methyl ester carboxylesterase
MIFSPAATAELVAPQAEGMRAQIAAQDDAAFAASQQMGVRSLVQDPLRQSQVVEWSIASDRATFAGAIHALMTTDLRPRLGAITAPVTVLAAANPFAPRNRIEPLYTAAYAGLPQLKLTVIEDSYHFIMYDQPAAFEAALREGLVD